MSKGAYSVVTYPSSSVVEQVLDRFRGAGASCMWVFHDKDLEDDGKPKKEHFHICCGWSKGFPDWETFCSMCGMISGECFTGDRKKHKSPSCFAKLTPKKCIVHDMDALELYFLHADDVSKTAGKHEYSVDELFKDPSFLGSSYTLATQKRVKASDNKRAQKAADFAAAVKFIRDNHISEWCELVDKIMDDAPELTVSVTSNSFPLKAYLDSYRNSGKADKTEKEMYEQRIAALESLVKKYESGDKPKIDNLTTALNLTKKRLTASEAEHDKLDRAFSRAVGMLIEQYANCGEFVTYTDVVNAIYGGI